MIRISGGKNLVNGLIVTSYTFFCIGMSVVISSSVMSARLAGVAGSVDVSKNPVLLKQGIEALNAFEERNAHVADRDFITKNQNALFSDFRSSPRDPKDGRVVAEFIDYNCTFCKRAHRELESASADGKPLQMVVHQIPILTDSSRTAARAALAASMQGKFEIVHRLLMNSRTIDQESISVILRQAGVDLARARRDMFGAEVDSALKRDAQLAKEMGITGTPIFITSAKVYRGYLKDDLVKDLEIDLHDAK